jgi:hypothetical protein
LETELLCSLCKSGGTVEHTYKEGVYDAKIMDLLLMVKNRSNSKVVVSFKAPENLVVTIENDLKFLSKCKSNSRLCFVHDVYLGWKT